jgi:hypothetical protein
MALTSRGQIFRFDDLEFYAWGGVIVMHDHGKEQDICCTVQDFNDRADALEAALEKEIHFDRRLQVQRIIDNMRACAKQAKAQGDPTDPEVLRFLATHSRRSTVNGAAVGRQVQDTMRREGVGPCAGSKTKLWTPASY